MCFVLQTNLATPRTFVRLRGTKNTAKALFLLGLFVLHHFFLSPLSRSEKCSERYRTQTNLADIDIEKDIEIDIHIEKDTT